MKKVEKIYCFNCGHKNEKNSKRCISCHKKLNQKDHEFIEYIVKKELDNYTGSIFDMIYDFCKSFLRKYLYGIAVTISLVFSVLSGVINYQNNNQDIEIVSGYTFKKNLLATFTCPEKYSLEKGKCVKTTSTSADIQRNCQDDYDLVNNSCISKQTFEKTETKTCELPLNVTIPNKEIGREPYISLAGDCIVPTCTKYVTEENKDDPAYQGYDIGECVEGGGTKIDFTYRYSCNNGSLVNGECRIISNPLEKYSCKEGTLDGKMCILKESIPAVVSCPKNYEYNKKVNRCIEK